MSTLTNWDGAKMKVNLAYGVEFEHFFTEDFSAAAGLLFTNQGAKFEDEGQIKLHYVAFPITANYYVLPGLAVKAGVQPAYRVKTQMKDSDVTVDFDRFIETVFQDFDYNMPKFELEILDCFHTLGNKNLINSRAAIESSISNSQYFFS